MGLSVIDREQKLLVTQNQQGKRLTGKLGVVLCGGHAGAGGPGGVGCCDPSSGAV